MNGLPQNSRGLSHDGPSVWASKNLTQRSLHFKISLEPNVFGTHALNKFQGGNDWCGLSKEDWKKKAETNIALSFL